ncbi:MAG: hypothetical protein N2690_09805, partial [Rhodocyclaceae bacterium]|nr:hypothetical protein [Rhodocyclaceae bacterium]
AARDVQEALKTAARTAHREAQERYTLLRALAVGGTVIALLFIAAMAFFLLRSIVKPLNRAIGHFDRMAQGNLTDE